MKLISREFKLQGRQSEIEIYPLGDIHIGSRDCAEGLLRKVIKEIKDNPNARWIGGGDYLDAIKPSDSKRFDMDTFPDWLLEGDATTTRERLNDVLRQQFDRCVDLLEPISNKCLGLIEGNHEYSIRKYYNQNIHGDLCRALDAEDLTDQSLFRLIFKAPGLSRPVFLYACHGHGGGRSVGSEPNKLNNMLCEWEIADICLRGHSHTHNILTQKPVLYVPGEGALPKELLCRYRHAANWGCWMLSHKVGKSTYVSRACYPSRPMMTCKVVIKPFARKYMAGKDYTIPNIEIRSITL